MSNTKAKLDNRTVKDEHELIKVLQTAISLIRKGGLEGLYPLLESDTAFAAAFSKTVSKRFNVTTFFEIDEIAGYFADVWKRWSPRNASDWMRGFDSNFYLNVVDCYNIAPLDTPVAFSPNSEIKRTRQLLSFEVSPVCNSVSALHKYLSSHIPGFKCTKDLLDHFVKKSNNALLLRNLLILKFKAARERNKYLTCNSLKSIRILAELIAAESRIQRPFGSFTKNTLVLEYRPKFQEFQYNWNSDISNLSFGLTDAFFSTLNTQRLRHIYAFLSTETGNKGFRHRILTGVHFFIKGYRSTESLDRFIFFAISLEALFSRDKLTPIRTTLADYVSLLSPIGKRIEVHNTIKKIYDIRSKIFHSGEKYIEEEKLLVLQALLVKCIFVIFELLRKHPDITEELFFKYLLERKLSVPISALP